MLDFLKRNKLNTTKLKYEKIIIVGAGEVGYHLARRLSHEDCELIVIDKDPVKLASIQDSLDVQGVLGSGCNPQTLIDAGIEAAHVCIAATNDDEKNTFICVYAGALNPNIARLARIRNDDYIKYAGKLTEKGVGITTLVNPDEEVVRTIDRLLSLPEALDYAEFALGTMRMVSYKMEEGPIIGEPLSQFRTIVDSNDILVAAIRRDQELRIPKGNDVIEKGDQVYFVYKSSIQKKLLKVLKKTKAFFSSACIIGGGNIGLKLAHLFENNGIEVKLIEYDKEKAKDVASELKYSLVLHGDARDKDLLVEENIGKMDVLVSVTADEETNILTCLLAKSLGVSDCVARVNNSSYVSLLSNIGINHSVSPRLAAVTSFINFIRDGKIFTSVTIGVNEAEIVEVGLSENSSYINKPIKDLNLPKDILLLSILRQGVSHIPQGNTVLEVDDHIIILGTPSAIKLIEIN